MFKKAILMLLIAVFTQRFAARDLVESNQRQQTLTNTRSKLTVEAMSSMKKRNAEYVPGDWFKSHISSFVKRNPQTYTYHVPDPIRVLTDNDIADSPNHISNEGITTIHSTLLSQLEDMTDGERSKDTGDIGIKECRDCNIGQSPHDVILREATETITIMLNMIQHLHGANSSGEFTKDSMIQQLVARRKQLADLKKRNHMQNNQRDQNGFQNVGARAGERSRNVLKRPFDSLASGLIGKRSGHSNFATPL